MLESQIGLIEVIRQTRQSLTTLQDYLCPDGPIKDSKKRGKIKTLAKWLIKGLDALKNEIEVSENL